MTTRPPLVVWLGLAVVLLAAAILSFEELRNLALAVGISARWAWLLPIAVDAGAAVSCSVWLGGRSSPDAAEFAGRMTWALLATTVAGNAAQLGMASARITPPWWCAVLVGAIPPAVVGATVHLVVLLVRRSAAAWTAETAETTETVDDTIADPAPAEQHQPPPAGANDAAEGAPPRLVSLTRPRPHRRTPRPPTRRARSDALTDEDALTRARQWIDNNGGELPTTRRQRRDATGCGDERARSLIAQLAKERRAS